MLKRICNRQQRRFGTIQEIYKEISKGQKIVEKGISKTIEKEGKPQKVFVVIPIKIYVGTCQSTFFYCKKMKCLNQMQQRQIFYILGSEIRNSIMKLLIKTECNIKRLNLLNRRVKQQIIQAEKQLDLQIKSQSPIRKNKEHNQSLPSIEYKVKSIRCGSNMEDEKEQDIYVLREDDSVMDIQNNVY
ncbi:unnamed protein product [Paramecium sonneborni]|uniref:Uncharacterized protein n=1 Tax=Paramecium sonneborni TaxID=65129 RepID=A0A8S1RTR6_9CILI|nr:unnamed protein product [Paramecium sonneborni]